VTKNNIQVYPFLSFPGKGKYAHARIVV